VAAADDTARVGVGIDGWISSPGRRRTGSSSLSEWLDEPRHYF